MSVEENKIENNDVSEDLREDEELSLNEEIEELDGFEDESASVEIKTTEARSKRFIDALESRRDREEIDLLDPSLSDEDVERLLKKQEMKNKRKLG